MSRVFRLLLCCCLGLLISAVMFLWLVWASIPAKSPMPARFIMSAGDTIQENYYRARVVRQNSIDRSITIQAGLNGNRDSR